MLNPFATRGAPALPPWTPFEPPLDGALPFYIVTLSQGDWGEALAYARGLPAGVLPELRLDRFPGSDPCALVTDLGRRCLVSCRRREDGGGWEGPEQARTELLGRAAEGRPLWLDLEWDLPIPSALEAHLCHLRLLRSLHVPAGVFDLGQRLQALPLGDAFKWVGEARRLAENAALRPTLAWARDRRIRLSAFLRGCKGWPSRCLQAAWGGAFTYAAPDGEPAAAPGQLPLALLQAWNCHRLGPTTGLCAAFTLATPNAEASAPFNALFRSSLKDLLHLSLPCGDAGELLEALDPLGVLGAALDPPFRDAVARALGLAGTPDTIWRRDTGSPWSGTDLEAPAQAQRFIEACGG